MSPKNVCEKISCVGLNGYSPTNTQALYVWGLQLPCWDIQWGGPADKERTLESLRYFLIVSRAPFIIRLFLHFNTLCEPKLRPCT